MISGNCPHCRSSIAVGYVPADVKLFCQSCGKSLSLREAYDFRSYTRLKKQIEQSDSREIKATGIQLNPTNTAQAIKQTPSKPSKMSDSELLRKIAKHSEESAFVLKRFLFVAQVFAALWLIGNIVQFIMWLMSKSP